MAIVTSNMGLHKWDQGSDKFKYAELASTIQKIDDHDHSTGKGKQIPAGGLQNNSVTSSKIAEQAVGTEKIAPAAATTAKLANGAVTPEKVNNSLKPSGSAVEADEALRALGTATGNAAKGKHASQHRYGEADPIMIESRQIISGNAVNHLEVVTSLPSNPPDRREVLYYPSVFGYDHNGTTVAATGGLFHLMYDATESSEFKWFCLGGQPAITYSLTQKTYTGVGTGYFAKPLRLSNLHPGLYQSHAEAYVGCVGESTLTGVGACFGPSVGSNYPPGTIFMGRSQNAAPILASRTCAVQVGNSQDISIGTFADEGGMTAIIGHATITAMPVALKVSTL